MKNYLKIGVIASVLTISMNLFSNNSVAKTPSIIVVQKSCDKLIATIDQKKCYEKAFYQAEKKLNVAVNRLKSIVENDPLRGKDQQKALLDSQQSWLKFRDSNCYFRSSGWGGTTRVTFQLSCLERMTRERTQELEELIKN